MKRLIKIEIDWSLFCLFARLLCCGALWRRAAYNPQQTRKAKQTKLSCSAALHSLFLSLCWLRRFTRLASLALLAFRKEMEEKKKSCLISLAVGPKTFHQTKLKKFSFIWFHSHLLFNLISSFIYWIPFNYFHSIHKWREEKTFHFVGQLVSFVG